MPVHLYGHPARMRELDAHRRASTASPSTRMPRRRTARRSTGVPVGTFGAFAMFSPLPDEEHDQRRGRHGRCDATPRSRARVRLLRNQGMERQYENEVIGFNARMTDIHAAIGRVQLTKVGWLDRDPPSTTRRSSTRTLRGVVVPPVADGAVHVYHQYTIRVPEDRDGFVARAQGGAPVGSGVYYPIPNHRLPSLDALRSRTAPAADRARGGRGRLASRCIPSLSAGRPRPHRRRRERAGRSGRLMADAARRAPRRRA